jgi:hypothetical protein
LFRYKNDNSIGLVSPLGIQSPKSAGELFLPTLIPYRASPDVPRHVPSARPSAVRHGPHGRAKSSLKVACQISAAGFNRVDQYVYDTALATASIPYGTKGFVTMKKARMDRSWPV